MRQYGEPVPYGAWEVDRWEIETKPGTKSPKDIQIWVATPGGSLSLLSFSTFGAMFRLWWMNEEINYPVAAGREGGERPFRYMRDAVEHGIEKAALMHELPIPSIRVLRAPEARAVRTCDNCGKTLGDDPSYPWPLCLRCWLAEPKETT
jgi:hypothetical protein